MNKKVCLSVHSVVFLILIGLMTVATIFDLSISNTLYSNNWFSVLGAVLGKLPAWFFVSFAGGILFANVKNKDQNERFRLTLLTIYATITVAGMVMLGYSIVEDVVVSKIKYIIAITLGIGLGLAMLGMVLKIKKETLINLKKWAITSLIVVVLVLIFTLLIKTVWGRARYQDIITGDLVFSKWFIPKGLTGNASMPSGHMALGACIFLTVPLFISIPSLKKMIPVAYFLSFVFCILIGLSRIIGGYHFLSDVVTAFLISYTTMVVTVYIFYGIDCNKLTFNEKSVFNLL